nr:protein translocase subunit SecF [Candidatus Erwinia haradaeae]
MHCGKKVIDFMRWNKVVFLCSIILLIVSISIVSIRGFNWGLDFTGGTVIELKLERPVDLDLVRYNLKKIGLGQHKVQNLESLYDLIIQIAPKEDFEGTTLSSKVVSTINNSIGQNVIVTRIEVIGPRVGENLPRDAGIALFSAWIAIFIYISYRFSWKLSLGVVLALIHDIVITIGLLSIFKIEIDLTIIASLLSVIGYSLNDKIVVSDRIRENFFTMFSFIPYYIINLSLTQTLIRTIITSLITLVMAGVLFIFGGSLLKGFSLTMIIGIIIGTISSVYVSSSLSLKIGLQRENMFPQMLDNKNQD